MRTVVDELVMTELLFDGALASLDEPEIAGLFSCFVSKGKAPPTQEVPQRLQMAKDVLVAITHRVAALQEIPPSDHERNVLNYSMLEVAYHWAGGMAFSDICALTPLLEGGHCPSHFATRGGL